MADFQNTLQFIYCLKFSFVWCVSCLLLQPLIVLLETVNVLFLCVNYLTQDGQTNFIYKSYYYHINCLNSWFICKSYEASFYNNIISTWNFSFFSWCQCTVVHVLLLCIKQFWYRNRNVNLLCLHLQPLKNHTLKKHKIYVKES